MWDIVSKLGPWPIAQFGLVCVIVVVSVLTYVKRPAPQKEPPPLPEDGGVHLYFSGPIKAIFDKLQILETHQLTNRYEMREMFSELLRETRHSLVDKLTTLQVDVQEQADERSEHSSTSAAQHSARLLHEIDECKRILISVRDMMLRIEARAKRT